jgi:predicted nucleic acid-binding Zn ribbon protein
MSKARTLFRACPECGRRFEIRLVDRKLKATERHSEELKRRLATTGWRGAGGAVGMRMLPAEESRPVSIYTEEFEYLYKCTHCGHEWSERRFEEKQVGGRLYPSSHIPTRKPESKSTT